MSKDTNQKKRILKALNPDYFNVDNRTLYDFYQEAQKMAESLVFYESTEQKPKNNWATFFEEAEQYLKKISEDENPEISSINAGQCPPHLGLFLTFIKLFGHTQKELNNLTDAHLHFFYNNILKEQIKGIRPDKAYVFFGLSRNTEKYLLPRGATLQAGKDARGNEITYSTDRELFINDGKIAHFKATNYLKGKEGSINAFPVANSLDGFGAPLEAGQGWYPFGNPTIPSSAEIGIAIGSPMFFLREGLRIIQLSFSLEKNTQPEILPKPNEFEAKYTGEKQWYTKNIDNVLFQDGKLTFVIQLNEVDPPTAAFDKKYHLDAVDSLDFPLLKIVLKKGFKYSRYAFFQSLQFTHFNIKVNVEKAHNLLIKNDYGILDASRTFQPFGYSPVIGANLYLGLEEMFYKPITKTSIDIKWKGLPIDFKNYYEGYKGPTNSLVRSKEDFKVKVAVSSQRSWRDVENLSNNSGEFALFDQPFHINLDNLPKENESKFHESRRENGMIRLSLSSPPQAFGHTVYPMVYARAIMGQLQEKAAPLPHEPYTPSIDSIELSYTAEETIRISDENIYSLRFFHIEPFGISEVSSLKRNTKSLKSLPLFSDEFTFPGNLYLGLENFNPPQQMSVFFKISEESIQDKPDLLFYYLSKSGWRLLSQNHILSDTTLGLKQTGIIFLSLPEALTSKSTRMPTGFYWIRISVKSSVENFDRIQSVRTNAVSCTLNYNPSLVGLQVNSLPPGSIQKFSKKIAEIKKVEQPYSSFGGRPAEKKIDYYTRVSEKLRHKMRGITSWDIERLILANFPEIFKVKCIQHEDKDGLSSPGHIHVIVIPMIKHSERVRILKPMVRNSTLTEIRDYLTVLASPHAIIHVTNPEFEEIKIEAAINFHVQVDAGFYLQQLQNDLQHFLSPWAFKEEIEIQLGKRIYRSSIIEFIESRNYVNFIASIKLLKNNREIQDHEISPDERTIIVSADSHKITAISSDRVMCQTNQGIAQMIIDINFEIQ